MKYRDILLKIIIGLFLLYLLGVVLALLGFKLLNPLLAPLRVNLVGEKGIFVNCQNPENKRSEFCLSLAKRATQQKTGREVNRPSLSDMEKGPSVPFSLSE